MATIVALVDIIYHYLIGNAVRRLHELHATYGGIVRCTPTRVSICTISAFREVYGTERSGSKNFLKGHLYTNVGSVPDIFTVSDPAQHQVLRKLFGPSFAPGQAKRHEDTIKKHFQRLTEVIENEKDASSIVELNPILVRFMVDNMTEILMGKSLDTLTTGDVPKWVLSLRRILYWAPIMEWLEESGFPLIFRWVSRNLIPSRVREAFFPPLETLIKDQMNPNGPKRERDMMAQVMERAESSSVPRQDMIQTFMVLMLLSLHSTQTAVTSIIHFVLQSPSTHRKLVDELRGAFASTDEITDDVARKLPYLNAVIIEALRMYPPAVAAGPRVSQGGYVDGHYIPRGAEIFGSIFSLQHNPQYFEEPFRFCPERWIDQELRGNKEAVLPFIIGSRSCIAKHLAMTMLRTITALFFVRFDAKHVGEAQDWVRDSTCYVMWELPSLKVQL
ncbi:cytochrome P450 [Aspergillus tamarii]|uniref:Cytochrome P450 n=1 Tax=Aspergillus tamarii TaxID=41984 RepID=A0A5N6UJ08_ASPTM|nr:cytochrome P450 [Aspergillus tamarii]